jgi:hypothetical protein
MRLNTVLVTAQWTLDRPNERARITCDLALVSDEIDDGHYELRLALNGVPVLARVFETQDEALAEADRLLGELVSAGRHHASIHDAIIQHERCSVPVTLFPPLAP